MTIAFIYKFFPAIGGVERVMTTLANAFVASGVEVIIFSFQQHLEKPFYYLEKTVEILHLPDYNTIDSKSNAEYIAEVVNNKKVEIIVNHDTTADSIRLCKETRNLIKIPIITLHHGQIYLPKDSLKTIATRKSKYNIRNLLFPLYCLYDNCRRTLHHKKNIQVCDAYIVLAHRFRDQLNNQKVYTIPNPLSYQKYFDTTNYETKEKTVLMVGRLSEAHKRIAMALEIWKDIAADKRYHGWRFKIAGDGPDRQMYERIIAEQNIPRVELLGMTDVQPLYEKASILIMTSAFEGFPLVLMEASQNACVPVVMDSFETVKEMIHDKKDGRIIKNNDLTAFQKAMEDLMLQPQKLTEYATAAVENSRRFSIEIILPKWYNLFNILKNGKL